MFISCNHLSDAFHFRSIQFTPPLGWGMFDNDNLIKMANINRFLKIHCERCEDNWDAISRALSQVSGTSDDVTSITRNIQHITFDVTDQDIEDVIYYFITGSMKRTEAIIALYVFLHSLIFSACLSFVVL
jgi:hypothetical protein